MLGRNNSSNDAASDNLIKENLTKLEKSLYFPSDLINSKACSCNICSSGSIPKSTNQTIYHRSNFNVGKSLYRILNGLASPDAPGLKIYIPDISFIEGNTISVFSTGYYDNRLIRIPGSVPLRNLCQTMIRLKKNYKSMLEENFNQNFVFDTIDPKYIHEKYLNQLLPTHFHAGNNSEKLNQNRNKFKRYILHKNPKYTISAIQQHKMNPNEPFVIIYYKDGNTQLYSHHQFETFIAHKTLHDIVYVQSFIKEKQQLTQVFSSSYTQFSPDIRHDLFSLAELQVLVLIKGIDKFNDKYKSIEQLEDNGIEMMKNFPQDYAIYSTYRVVHYLAMVSRYYLKKISINWTLNDMGILYIQSIFDVESTEISERQIKFRLPPKDSSNFKFYKDSQKFKKFYLVMGAYQESKRQRIRNELQFQKIHEQETQIETSRTGTYSVRLQTPKSQTIQVINKTHGSRPTNKVERKSLSQISTNQNHRTLSIGKNINRHRSQRKKTFSTFNKETNKGQTILSTIKRSIRVGGYSFFGDQ